MYVHLRRSRPRADDSEMSESAPEPTPGVLAVFRGLRRRVQEGKMSWPQALGAIGLVLLAWLFAAACFVVLCYFVSGAAVDIARGGGSQDLQWDDPDVVAVAVSLAVAIVVVATVGTLWYRRRAARRRARMQLWADAHGWVYSPRSSLLSNRWSAPGIRSSTHATDVLTRSTPRGEVISMTVRPSAVDGGANRHAVMVAGARRFPVLSLTPMSSLDRVERAFGGQQITVESYAINERWRMRCADERFAHEVLHPRLLERLDRTAMPELCFLVQGSDVVVHAPGPTRFASIEPMADLVLDLVSLLPAYLPDDYPPFSPDVPRRERRRFPRRVR